MPDPLNVSCRIAVAESYLQGARQWIGTNLLLLFFLLLVSNILLLKSNTDCREPLHFYPETSLAQATGKSVNAKWLSGYNHHGEGEDPAYQLGLRGHAPFDQQFAELAALLLPLLDGMKD